MSLVEKEKSAPFDNGPKLQNGQYAQYAVLPEEERKKGFVRPVRRSYQHVGIRPRYPLRDLSDEEKKEYAAYGYAKFELYPESESPRVGRFWTESQLHSGCGVVTTMSDALAETYARDPSYYGSTFCCGCSRHIRVEEFVWEGTTERVGS